MAEVVAGVQIADDADFFGDAFFDQARPGHAGGLVHLLVAVGPGLEEELLFDRPVVAVGGVDCFCAQLVDQVDVLADHREGEFPVESGGDERSFIAADVAAHGDYRAAACDQAAGAGESGPLLHLDPAVHQLGFVEHPHQHERRVEGDAGAGTDFAHVDPLDAVRLCELAHRVDDRILAAGVLGSGPIPFLDLAANLFFGIAVGIAGLLGGIFQEDQIGLRVPVVFDAVEGPTRRACFDRAGIAAGRGAVEAHHIEAEELADLVLRLDVHLEQFFAGDTVGHGVPGQSHIGGRIAAADIPVDGVIGRKEFEQRGAVRRLVSEGGRDAFGGFGEGGAILFRHDQIPCAGSLRPASEGKGG